MPRISICIPAYNAEKYLQETLDSVRLQTFKDWELIVTEDGSKDGVEAMVHAFAKTVEQPVRYQRHEVNQGLPATRNTGIAASQCEWIALLDSDDCWLPEHLETAVAVQAESGADIVHSGSLLFDSETGRDLGVRAPDAEVISRFPLSMFVGDYLVQPSSVLLCKGLWERVGGFDPTFRYVEDAEMWLRCARNGARFVYTGKNTCRYRKHREALSTHSAEMSVACARVFEKHLDWEILPKEVRRRSASDAWSSAARILQRSEPRRAADYLLRAWRAGASGPNVLLRAGVLRLYALLARR